MTKLYIILLVGFCLTLAGLAWAETWECPQCGNDFQVAAGVVEAYCPYCHALCLWFVCENCGNSMIVSGDWEEFTCPVCGATYRAVYNFEEQAKSGTK
jgi:uncharacterized Zn-finger protein